MAYTSGLKGELEGALAAVDDEIAKLDVCMDVTQTAMDSKTEPIDAVAKWYAVRGTRVPSERLCDPVKADLQKITATLHESVRLLESALSAQQSEKMRLLLRKAALEADIADKAGGLELDNQVKGLSLANTRPVTAPSGGRGASMSLPAGMNLLHAPFDPVQWRASSKTICAEADKVVQVSARLRATTEKLIADRVAAEAAIYHDLLTDYTKSVSDIKTVIASSEAQIAACEGEMAALSQQIGACEAGFQAKQASYGVAVDRLHLRAGRPTRELVMDAAQRSLANELTELKAGARALEGSAQRLSVDGQRLAKTVEALNETVGLKQHFLGIEEAAEPMFKVLGATYDQAMTASMSPYLAFRSSAARPVSALPANRLSLSRMYATR